MAPITRNESARVVDGGEVYGTPADAEDESFGRRVLRYGLLLLGTAVGVRVGVAILRRRRRPEREFTRIELDADPSEP